MGGKEAVSLHPPRKYVQPSTQVRASKIEPKNIHTWQKVPHEHVVRDLPDSLSHGINPRCSLNHHLDFVEVILARKCTRQPNGFRSISLT